MIHELIRAALVPATLLFVALLVVLYLRVYRFNRTANDVVPYLRWLDFEQMQDLLSPEQDRHFRQHLPARQFREFQEKRIRLSVEFLVRSSHNAEILRSWGWYELRRSWRTKDRKAGRTSRELINAAVQCKIIGLALRFKLYFWLLRMTLFPFLGTPGFAALLPLGSSYLLRVYTKTKVAAVELSRMYGAEYHEQLVQVL